jgi:hypothetical protein
MKKHLIFLLSVILTLNYLTLAANDYLYGEKNTPNRSEGEMCEIRIFMWNTEGTGWYNNSGIEITVDGVNYGGIIKIPYAFEIYEGEETVLIPSGEVLFSWIGHIDASFCGFEIYNTLGELIYTSPNDHPIEGLFFTYQNECPTYEECLPITDFEGIYIPEDKQVKLTWVAPESDYLKGFDIYRNEELIDQLLPDTTFYTDNTENLKNGTYKYCVIPVYPFVCNLDEECFEAHINVGVADYNHNILIYPNPANNVINITGDRVSTVKMYNNIGQLILTQHNTNTINVSTLTNGLYLLTIELTTGDTTQKKIIVNH